MGNGRGDTKNEAISQSDSENVMVVTPVTKSLVYKAHRATEELRLDLLQEQRNARETLVSKQVLEDFSQHAARKLKPSLKRLPNGVSNSPLAGQNRRETPSQLQGDVESSNNGNCPTCEAGQEEEEEEEVAVSLPVPVSLPLSSSQHDPVLVANGGLTWFKYFHPDVQANIYAAFTIYRFAPGQVICQRGEWVHGLHVVVQGGAYVINQLEYDGDDKAEPPGFGEGEMGKWIQPFEIINAHVLEGAIATGEGLQRRGEEERSSQGEDGENDPGVLSAVALMVGHSLAQVTIRAAQEDTYGDPDSSSDDDDDRSVVLTDESSSSSRGGCTTMYLDAQRVKSILVDAIERGVLFERES